MFTGIVEAMGTVLSATPNRLTVASPLVVSGTQLGESIAVSGVCLTVVECRDGTFTADVMPETLRRTTLGDLTAGRCVNLERAVRADGRLGGHIVQGHVDGVAELTARDPGAAFDTFHFALDPSLGGYVVPKGSIAVDGVSLTVVETGLDHFTVGLIPATLRGTTLGGLEPGGRVNVEVDVIAKYVERLFRPWSVRTPQEPPR
jgi:riboflavin synthase